MTIEEKGCKVEEMRENNKLRFLSEIQSQQDKQLKGLKMKYQDKVLNDDLTIKELKANTYLMFKAIGSDQVAKDSQVWIKESNSYCREDKKYIVTNCADHNKIKLVDGSKKIFTSFTY